MERNEIGDEPEQVLQTAVALPEVTQKLITACLNQAEDLLVAADDRRTSY